ncbi:hypothetical protein DFQ28_004578 [Apophysomyces sp. BC1034]|nr:hypothetical protein DFQ30_004455 [Apophysomyces sp. BC1015]KAG0178311.1 hypothetical protein DFQ29_003631 [Apophysomyces sp. BC1021]KAG0188641.1 hypothetical protein DFQ28_004578 [Apophysomyces sp. BC1034]
MRVNFLSLAVSVSVAISSLTGAVQATKTIRTKVVILGGGVSGISAARNLTQSGIDDFVIVEARDILGGRAQDAAFADTRVELGCNWVQGLGTNPINELRKKYKLKTAVTNGDDVTFYDQNGKIKGGKKTYDRFNEAYEAVAKMSDYRIANNMADVSVRTSLDMVGWKPLTPLEKAVEYYVFDWESAETPEVSSSIYSTINDNATYNGFGPGSDGDLFVVDKRGFKYPFIQEAKKFLKQNDSRLKLNTQVTKVEYNKKGVTVYTDKDEIIHADYAIVTFSLGVLQNNDVKWAPEFPSWKKEGLAGFHMATYTKIFMNFPYQFWDDNQFTVYADPGRRGYFNAWQNLNAKGFYPKNTTTNIFFVTVTQDQSYDVESMTDKEVQDEIMVVLRSMYGDHVPEPTEFLFPRWHSNPLFRGTYSNWPIGELGQHHVNMKAPLNNRLFFAGEAMHNEEFGFLQGAWLSGEETAANVAQCIKKRCPRAEYFPVITNAKLRPDFIRKRGYIPGYI